MNLYKYRGFGNLEFALDIFVKQRLYAASFQELNDPMEGRFVYPRGSLERSDVEQILGEKASYGIVALSETSNNTLMWSYYAEAHSGFAVGVEITDTNASVEPVRYVDDFDLGAGSGDVAKRILGKKFRAWEHEKERRVFVRKRGPQEKSFVDVQIRELIFGCKAADQHVELLTTIAEKFCDNLEVRQLCRGDLDSGVVSASDYRS